jgi:hypothetical protein
VAEAVNTAVYLRNRSITSAIPETKTPYSRWHKEPFTLPKLQIFGSQAWVHIPKEKNLGKLGTKAQKCFFVGYAGTNHYRLYDPATRIVIIIRDVWFNESSTDQNDTQSYDIELNMDDLLSKRKAEARAQETRTHDKQPEQDQPDLTDSDSDSDIGSVIELAAPKPPRPAVPASKPGNQPRRFTQSNIGIPARRFGGVAIIIDPRIAQIRTANLSARSSDSSIPGVGARNRSIPKSYPDMRQLPDSEQKLWETAMVTEYAGLL